MSTILDGSFTSTGAQFNLALPSGYTEFKLVNITDLAGNNVANTNVMRAYGTSLMAPGQALLNLKTTGANTLALESFINTGGFTFWNPSNPPTFAVKTVTGVSSASPAVVSVTAHGYAVGDTVRFSNLNGTMTPLNGLTFTVNSVSTDTFTITLDTTANAGGQIGATPATSGNVQKVLLSPFSPQNVVIGPSSPSFVGNNFTLRMNVSPAFMGASQYSPFLPPYQPGAKLRLYVPNGFGSNGYPSTAGFVEIQVISVTTASGYAVPNLLTASILPGNPAGTVTTANGLADILYLAGTATFSGNYPYVTDIAEQPGILSEAEDNTGFYGITIGTGVQTSGVLYQWFARQGYTI